MLSSPPSAEAEFDGALHASAGALWDHQGFSTVGCLAYVYQQLDVLYWKIPVSNSWMILGYHPF
jgi:hypothetical protein